MLVLADSPESARAFVSAPLSAAAAWTELAAAQLEPVDARLWRALGSGDRVLRLSSSAPPELDFWSRVIVVANASRSQFDILRGLAGEAEGLPGPIACVAIAGDGFHGHRGRAWRTEAGNLHLSVACDPGLEAARCGLALTALPAVALAEGVESLGPWRARPQIKWVNDLMLAGRKVGGVLTATQAARDRLTAAVFGIGLNVAVTPAVEPSVFVPTAGSLAEFGTEPSLGRCLTAVLARLAHWLDRLRAEGPAPLLDAYRCLSLVVGREVEVWPEGLPEAARRQELPPPERRGTVIAIGDDLALQLAGQPEPVARGRLALVSPAESNRTSAPRS